jgi:aspartate/methionine/tyrosine aminotransferase
MPPKIDPLTYFHLKPIHAARVSEISETTTAAAVPAEERVNFHIGNPLQDERLSSAFLRNALGIEHRQTNLRDDDPDAIMEALGWEKADKPKLELLIRTIQKSSPYMPRGGYPRKNPNSLVKLFCSWLERQQEPLEYDTGEKTGRREIILTSGGIHEALRIFLFSISAYLETIPARVLCFQCALPAQLKTIPNILFEDLNDNETAAREQIEQFLVRDSKTPTFLLIGSLLSEETRRKLRLSSTNSALFFVEINNAPNHLSLAREAKLIQRVIRFLTPGIFENRLSDLSTVFAVGNADFLNVIENVHFSMKGTPSASEVEFLSYLLNGKIPSLEVERSEGLPRLKPTFEGLGMGGIGEPLLGQMVERVEGVIERRLDSQAQKLEKYLSIIEEKSSTFLGQVRGILQEEIIDEFASIDTKNLLDLFVQNVHQQAWRQRLLQSFLFSFTRHQPQYRVDACMAVSGSSRTALGILGFHCGIDEVVVPDLSWSYEQCFPTIHAVPMTEALDLDDNGMIVKVKQLLQRDPSWKKHGAVVINNPHNATGKILNGKAIRSLIRYCLQHDITLIDDLAYQNVAPLDDLPEIKTVRQIAEEMVLTGELNEKQSERVITVHSMSKTDCLAGARLSVVEIRDEELRKRFEGINSLIQPNIMAIFICYLFYRNNKDAARSYWGLRNAIFHERTKALLAAVANLSPDRNPYGLNIIPPTGSMYPLLQINKLPAGLSLDWLASSLARRGIGLLPLATFARTEEGYEIGRTTFRLTLGGVDKAEVLLAKTRRLLIDLNRLIGEEDARYNRRQLNPGTINSRTNRSAELTSAWNAIEKGIRQAGKAIALKKQSLPFDAAGKNKFQESFVNEYLTGRLEVFHTRLFDRALISDELVERGMNEKSDWLERRLAREFMKDSLPRRQELFRLRCYDRTVHPTQMYSLKSEMALDAILKTLTAREPVAAFKIENAAQELWLEFLGRNVVINSRQEAGEILLDLDTLTTGEEYAELLTNTTLTSFLSFWSDWDGSNRPSGQGHLLVGSVVMENARRLGRILSTLLGVDPGIAVNPELVNEIRQLPLRNQRFNKLLTDITLLTQQLEQRYHGILPYSVASTPLRRLAVRWHIRRDPARILWQHNDRYEQKMLELRQQRRGMLEYYFDLNKQLRKQLFALIPEIKNNRMVEPLLRQVVEYRDILQRTVITPRIHQSMITARDQFAIDTTVHNIYELNSISGAYGNPGTALAIQISFSTKPEALIALDRKMNSQAEQLRREHPSVEVPGIWLIPLFEDLDTVKNIRPYLEQVWEYAVQSRQTAQPAQERFAEIISEVFIAGSDLSQQVGQAAGALNFHKAKYEIQTWLAERGAVESMRIKLGSGEPMQRQGGYYSEAAGKAAFLVSEDSRRRIKGSLPPAARRSTAYAVTPLQGIFLGGDLRTFQSNLSEQLRFLPARALVELLYHVRETQRDHRSGLIRAAETMVESRLNRRSRSAQELERLTIGTNEGVYEDFITELTENFRQILYGREEDVVGIHIVSYFIGRSLPQLRDRPTSRPLPDTGMERSQQILANIAKIIPLARQGSLLRAIAHYQAQTQVFGINQLTTGLFRALERFGQKAFVDAERDGMTSEHILPHLPVYEILHTLRIYQDWEGGFLKQIENAFPAGNSAFLALREDTTAMQAYLPLFQQELLRRQGVTVTDFFNQGKFIDDLLPALRPDLAVLLQKDLSNTEIEVMLENVKGKIDESWRTEITRLLRLPREIQHWRSILWDVLGESIYQRVQSFSELATALYSFSSHSPAAAVPGSLRAGRQVPSLSGFFRTASANDEMRNFLVDAIEYLNAFAGSNVEVPVRIIRAINDVERLAQIEESSLPEEKLDTIRMCLLQIARLAGENG